MSKLYLVGTSIGNLEDVSIRSLKAIFESKYILAEDTRVFSRYKGLLKERHGDIISSLGVNQELEQKIYSYRDQNHSKVINQILQVLKKDNDIFLLSDSGMPGISDPGWKLIDKVIQNGYEVDTIPGPTALVSALLLSGLSTDRFTFLEIL